MVQEERQISLLCSFVSGLVISTLDDATDHIHKILFRTFKVFVHYVSFILLSFKIIVHTQDSTYLHSHIHSLTFPHSRSRLTPHTHAPTLTPPTLTLPLPLARTHAHPQSSLTYTHPHLLLSLCIIIYCDVIIFLYSVHPLPSFV
jgi:hypothetical protein